jgi:hypothetical protein
LFAGAKKRVRGGCALSPSFFLGEVHLELFFFGDAQPTHKKIKLWVDALNRSTGRSYISSYVNECDASNISLMLQQSADMGACAAWKIIIGLKLDYIAKCWNLNRNDEREKWRS